MARKIALEAAKWTAVFIWSVGVAYALDYLFLLWLCSILGPAGG